MECRYSDKTVLYLATTKSENELSKVMRITKISPPTNSLHDNSPVVGYIMHFLF